MVQNRAAFLDGPAQKPFRIADAELPQPGPDEVLVRNQAWAINPIDYKVQDGHENWIQNWPLILGNDVAGEIEAVGSNVTRFAKGDRVIGHATGIVDGDIRHGGFSLYTAVPAAIVSKIPSSLAYKDAVIFPLAIDTAAVGLYGTTPGLLGLPYPSLTPQDTGKVIVVWGGTSSVGAAAVQLAVASGVRVIATASPKHFDLVKRAGASEVFDYNSASVVSDIVASIKKGGTFAGVFDAIALAGQSTEKSAAIADQLGGGNLALTLPPPENLPKSVTPAFFFGIGPATHPVWENYVLPALEQGKLLPIPPAEVVGKGLESLQHAVDISAKGVSAKKIVVEA